MNDRAPGQRARLLELPPLSHARGAVRLPGSKSISNRVLLLAALAEGRTRIDDLLDSDDTRVMLAALRQLGVAIARDGASVEVEGCGGRFAADSAELFLGNAGTAIRPLTAALALTGGDYRVYGVARMHERPIGDLVDALNALGCAVRYESNAGFPPLRIGRGEPRIDAPVRVRGDVSSQFLSALLLALPLLAAGRSDDIVVEVTTPLISRPYVAITLAMLARFGVPVRHAQWQRFVIPAASGYRTPGRIAVEGDASSASYFLAAGVLGGGPLRVQGAGRASIQGDIGFARVLERLGARLDWEDDAITARGLQPGLARLRGGTVDCIEIPDAAMTLAVLALFADAPLTLTGIASWRVKETDRIAAMRTELGKLGAQVEAGDDFITVHPLSRFRSAEIATYDDHRMAMCFSLAAFGGVPQRILDPGCVAKTYPEYFSEFARVCG
jgi:3-phosphoshikimate 1-carboxyvinyltransferase